MKTRAAVAFKAKKPLEIVELDLEGSQEGEVFVEIMANGICHTDAYTLDGLDSEGKFPSVLGHEGAGIVGEVGPGVTSVAPDDHVVPAYIPECRQCKSCLSGKTNLCTAIRDIQGQGLMPNGTSRMSYKVEAIYHYMGCRYMNGKIEIDPMITHTLSLEEINKGSDLMHVGESIRSVVVY